MYERVLVPLDGSRLAEGILPFILQLAGPRELDVAVAEIVAARESGARSSP
jgi:hypothetical protein